MKSSVFVLAVILGSAACAQSTQVPASSAAPDVSSGVAQPPAQTSAAPEPTSSNPLESLPAMSADRCVAEAIGTATDPKTGAPVSATVDPRRASLSARPNSRMRRRRANVRDGSEADTPLMTGMGGRRTLALTIDAPSGPCEDCSVHLSAQAKDGCFGAAWIVGETS